MLWIFWIMCFTLSGLYQGARSECMARGRFPNDISEDCRGYTTCIATTTNSFYQYNLACPPNFIYNHFDSQCTNATGYHCLSTFNCTKLGNFLYSDSSDCMSYVTCIQALDTFTARLVDCPPKTVFNPDEAICVENTVYTCPSAIIKPDNFDNNQSNVSQHNVTDTSLKNNNSASFIGVYSLAYLIMCFAYTQCIIGF